MSILSQRLIQDVASEFFRKSGARVSFMDVSGKMVGTPDMLRSLFTRKERNYAFQESINRGCFFPIHCGEGVLCWIIALEDRRRIHGAAIGGPLLADSSAEEAARRHLLSISARSEPAVRRAIGRCQRGGEAEASKSAEVFNSIFYPISGWKPVLMKENMIKLQQQEQMAEFIADQKKGGGARPLYAFEKERALLASIRSGSRNESRSILNEMLSNIYMASGELPVLRARTVELMSYLTRAAVEDNPLLESLIRMNHLWTERLVTADSYEHLSERLMSALDEFIDAVYVQGVNRGSSSVRNAMNYVMENYGRQISLRDVAAHIGLSPWRTAHIVKEYTGKTVMENITDLRVRRAQQLLLKSEMSCTEIGLEVGFNDHSYFTKIFRRIAGVTPNRYRKGG